MSITGGDNLYLQHWTCIRTAILGELMLLPYLASKHSTTMSQIAGKDLGPIGFGLMGLTWRSEPASQEQAFETMRAALKNGCT